MAITHKVLYAGQLPSSKGALYTVAAATTGFIHNVILHNASDGAETVELFLNNGAEYQLLKLSVAARDTVYPMSLGNEGLVLAATHKIEGNTTTGTTVTCVIVGSEEA